jgi:putative tributyrin esterase
MPADYNASYTDDPQGSKYYTYAVEELPKMCQAIFPFSDKREDNFVAGLSMGAGGAFKCVVAHPEKYGAALCMSGGGRGPAARDNVDRTPPSRYVGAADDPINDPWNYAVEQVNKGVELPKFFFTCGTEDAAAYPDYLTTSQKLMDLGCNVFREEVPGYKHEWDFWDLSLRKAIKEWFPIRHSVIYPNEKG